MSVEKISREGGLQSLEIKQLPQGVNLDEPVLHNLAARTMNLRRLSISNMTVTSSQVREAISLLIVKILQTSTQLQELKLVSLNCSAEDSERIVNALGLLKFSTITVLWLNDNSKWWTNE